MRFTLSSGRARFPTPRAPRPGRPAAVGADLLGAGSLPPRKLESWSTMEFTVVPMRRNSPLTGWPSISSASSGQVALRDRDQHACDLGGGLHQVADERVDRADAGRPASRDLAERRALGHAALAADDLSSERSVGERSLRETTELNARAISGISPEPA